MTASTPDCLTLTEAYFGPPDPAGHRIVELGDDEWAAWGHIAPGEFQAAHHHQAALFYTNPGEIPMAGIRHAWAIMEPAWPGAPDDELVFRADVTWATPGAVPVTIGTAEDPPEPRRLKVVRTIEELIERSSLGAPEANAARARVSDEDVAAAMRRYRELGTDGQR